MININLYLVNCILLKERVQEKTKENFRGQPLKNSKRYGLFKQTMPLRISWRLFDKYIVYLCSSEKCSYIFD